MTPPPPYERHRGTLIISGTTVPRKAGGCACFFLEKGYDPIDFLCIGANANQQAVKAMGVMLHTIEGAEQNLDRLQIAFRPLHVTVSVEDRENPGKFYVKDATVWRLVLLARAEADSA